MDFVNGLWADEGWNLVEPEGMALHGGQGVVDFLLVGLEQGNFLLQSFLSLMRLKSTWKLLNGQSRNTRQLDVFSLISHLEMPGQCEIHFDTHRDQSRPCLRTETNQKFLQ